MVVHCEGDGRVCGADFGEGFGEAAFGEVGPGADGVEGEVDGGVVGHGCARGVEGCGISCGVVDERSKSRQVSEMVLDY